MRHAIITGECGAQGHYAKNSRMKLPQKWLELFAGYENENEGVNYKIAPFKVSNKCCLYMKEQPCDAWAKEHNSRPFLGLMASEGGQREEALTEHGCNYFGKNVIRSARLHRFYGKIFSSWPLICTHRFQKSTEQSREKRTEHSIPPGPSGPAAPCAVSECIWNSGHTGLISSENGTRRNGSSGCTGAARTYRRVKIRLGESPGLHRGAVGR